MSHNQKQLDCRFYRRYVPEDDELVRVRILEKEPHGFRCVLLEYNNIEGLVLLNELKRGRVRSYNKIMRPGKEYTVLVIRVHMNENDDTLGFPDLSLKSVPTDQLPMARDKWEKGKTVNGIFRQVAKCTPGYNTVDIYEKFGWPMADKQQHIYIGLKKIMHADKLTKLSPEDREATIKQDLIAAGAPEETVDTFYRELVKRMKPTPKIVRAVIEMQCLGTAAVEGIRKALQVSLDMSTEELPITTRVIAAPEFTVSCITMEPQAGKEKINEVLEKMKEALVKEKGNFKVKQAPDVAEEELLLTQSDAFKANLLKKQEEGETEEEEV